MNEFPEDYHDYVFRDGKLIGAFDDMYRHAKGVPWDQDKRCNHWYTDVGILMLRDLGPYDSILEAGCGLGYISAKLRQLVKPDGYGIDAFDVSAEAVRKAGELHPGIRFSVDDITRSSFDRGRQYDLVVIRDVFWYIFEQIDTVVSNLTNAVKPGGLLYLCQSFPALDGPFVGKETIPNPDALIDRFQSFDPVFSARLRNHRLTKDGPIIHFVGTKRG